MECHTANSRKTDDASKCVVAAVRAFLPGGADLLETPPEVPDVWLTPKDVARLFDRDPQTPKRWKRKGWIAPRGKGARVLYDAIAIVGLAARLFSRFRDATYDRAEAERAGLIRVLEWTLATVRQGPLAQQQPAPSVLDLVALAALAGDLGVLPSAWGITGPQLAAQRREACRQLHLRLSDPKSRGVLVRAWREAGLLAAVSGHDQAAVSNEHYAA